MKLKRALYTGIAAVGTAAMIIGLTGCGSSQEAAKKEEKPLTVYLWDTDLIEELTPYIHAQLPDKEIEFITGNNDTDLYSYLLENGALPDIITVRRYAGTDAKDLQSYLMDFSSYDVVSEYSSYALQYYKNSDGEIKWLPICGIPQTIIANKTLFDACGIDLPQDYEEYAEACRIFYENGIKPYALDLGEDWSCHEMIQAGGIGELTSLDGVTWRNNAESAQGDIAFDDVLWRKIFSETSTLLKDSYFTEEDLSYDTSAAMQLFVDGKAAMFHGAPLNLQQCQALMGDVQLVRIPYFSQSSREGFIYMTPSLHVAFNKQLEEEPEKLETALQVLECMISREGQQLIANGRSVISFNPDVPSVTDDMTGLVDEIENNNYYIRYSSQKSFTASAAAVQELLTGTRDEEQAYETFKSVINGKEAEAEPVVTFEKEYALALNDKGGREAASSILTTVREENGARLAFAPYYYFTSSIYKGACTENRIQAMIAGKSSSSPLYLEKLTGAEIRELVQRYVESDDGYFKAASRYELPIASGMKLVLQDDGTGFALQEILVDGEEIEDEKEYSILLTNGVISVLTKMDPEREIKALEDTSLSAAWISALEGGEQPAEPEDYVEVVQ